MKGFFIPADILDETDKTAQVKLLKERSGFSIFIGHHENSEKILGLDQLKRFSFYQALIAEILGTFLLVFFTIGFGLPIPDSNVSVSGIDVSLGSGLIVASLIWGIGHIGGAHMNPAVTLTFLVTGNTSLLRAFFYIPCQLLGSSLGTFTLKQLIPSYLTLSSRNFTKNSNLKQDSNSTEFLYQNSAISNSIGMTLLSDQITPLQGFLIEFFLTLILIITIFACMDKNRDDIGGSFPLTIGLTVTLCGLFGAKLTGASMNPARSFGPAFIGGNWSNHWIYWVGPITGAVLGAFIYKLLSFKKKETRKFADIYEAKINLVKI